MGSTFGKILNPPSDGSCFLCSRCRDSEESAAGTESDIKPTFPDNLTVCVSSVPFSVTEKDILSYFSKCGAIQRSNFLKDGKSKFKGTVFLTFKTKAGVDAALKYDGGNYGGRTLKVNLAGQDGKTKDGKATGKNKDGQGKDDKDTGKADAEKEIFVGGLAFKCKEVDLLKHFSQVGEIVSLRMPLNEEGKSKGIAFIRLKVADDVEKALKLDGSVFMGRTIKVNLAVEGKSKGKGKGKDGKPKDGKGKGKGLGNK